MPLDSRLRGNDGRRVVRGANLSSTGIQTSALVAELHSVKFLYLEASFSPQFRATTCPPGPPKTKHSFGATVHGSLGALGEYGTDAVSPAIATGARGSRVMEPGPLTLPLSPEYRGEGTGVTIGPLTRATLRPKHASPLAPSPL